MKITFYTYPKSMGDGSARVAIFRTQEEAYKLQDLQDKYCDGWAEDCVEKQIIEIDDNGNLVSGFEEG